MFILFLLVVIVLVVIICCDLASTVIYYRLIRKRLPESIKEVHFHWLPHKRKKQIDEYVGVHGEDNPVAHWGRISLRLDRITWITSIVGFLLLLYFFFFE